MITQDTDVGRLTDRIMLCVRAQIPEEQVPVSQMNRVHESVESLLTYEKAKVSTDQLKLNLNVEHPSHVSGVLKVN